MKIKDIRLKSSKTQNEVAQYLNITQSGYSSYECGKTEPDINTLKKLSKFYNVSIDYLVDNQRTDDIGYLTFTQANVVKLIKQLSYENLMILNGRILAMLENQK